MDKAISVFDLHIPYHSKEFIECVLFACKLVKPKQFNIGGDLVDMLTMKKWKPSHKEELLKKGFDYEIAEANEFLSRLKDAVGEECDIVYYEGNHEDRFNRYMYENAREVYGKINLRSQLGIDDMDIKWVAYGRQQLGRVLDTSLFIRHSPYSYSVNAAMTNLKKHINIMCGCAHRTQSAAVKSASGDVIRSYMVGCGIDMQSEAFSYMSTDDWSHSFAITTSLGSGRFINEVVEVVDGECIICGKHIDGSKFL